MKPIFVKWLLFALFTVSVPITWGSDDAIPVININAPPVPANGPATTTNNSAVVTTPRDRSLVVQLLERLEQMQQETADLRGLLEQQQHTIEQMKSNQRDRYMDLDNRIRSLMNQPNTDSPDTTSKSAGTSSKPKPTVGKSSTSTSSPDIIAYQQAFSLIEKRKFVPAITALNQFLSQYPNSSRAANAQYWLGDLYLAQKDTERAQQAFNQVLTGYPNSNKQADTLYKLGVLWSQKDDNQKAKNYLNQVIKRYPNSGTAQLATDYLKTLQ